MRNVEFKAELRDPQIARAIARSIHAHLVATIQGKSSAGEASLVSCLSKDDAEDLERHEVLQSAPKPSRPDLSMREVRDGVPRRMLIDSGAWIGHAHDRRAAQAVAQAVDGLVDHAAGDVAQAALDTLGNGVAHGKAAQAT